MSICNLDHFEAMAARGERYALVGGCFDPLHGGHVRHLWEAKPYGRLVVAMATDEEIRQKHEPLLPWQDRCQLVDNLEPVTHVHYATKGIVPVLETLRPTHYIKGPDWVGTIPDEEVAACERYGIQIVHTHSKEKSSTEVLRAYQRRADQSAVAAFERVCLVQELPQPWAPVTPYDSLTRRLVEGQHPQLIKEVFQPERVLDYGAGFGHLVTMLREAGVNAVGYEPYIDVDHPHVFTQWRHVADEFDLVVYREVNEHVPLRKMRQAVSAMCAASTRWVYGTTRFCPSPQHMLNVATSDTLDPTHISLVTPEFLRVLFALEGFVYRRDLAERMDWKGYGRTFVFERG